MLLLDTFFILEISQVRNVNKQHRRSPSLDLKSDVYYATDTVVSD